MRRWFVCETCVIYGLNSSTNAKYAYMSFLFRGYIINERFLTRLVVLVLQSIFYVKLDWVKGNGNENRTQYIFLESSTYSPTKKILHFQIAIYYTPMCLIDLIVFIDFHSLKMNFSNYF